MEINKSMKEKQDYIKITKVQANNSKQYKYKYQNSNRSS